jgi:hypothetical protein
MKQIASKFRRALRTLPASTLLFACSPEQGSDDASGQIQIAISGEDIATDGIAFPTGSEVTIVDGWELELTHVLVTVGNVTLSENPDLDPTDQSRTGAVVARADGPWAVDLHEPGTLPGAGGEGLAIPLALLGNQTERGGAAFASADRYAFGYDILAASDAATIVNFEGDDEARAAYAEMVETGASVLYVGTATFRGQDCETSDAEYDFGKLPQKVPFRLAFRTPTSFVNCQNQDNQGDAFEDEEYPRGISIVRNQSTLAQITLHLEHALFSATEHDPSLRFDQLAARLVDAPEGTELTLDDLVGVDPTAFTDASGAAVPFRSCDGSPLPAGKQLRFEASIDPAAKPDVALRDYYDFIQYVQSAQGHLNGGEGLCFIDRHYPSPP